MVISNSWGSLASLIPLLAMGMVFMIVALGIRNEQKKRELEHLERMKALELGRKLPGEGVWTSPGLMGFLIAVGVPILALSYGWMSCRQFGYHEEIWATMALVSCMALACGTFLIWFGVRRTDRTAPAVLETSSKPGVDSDAFDVVSRRGEAYYPLERGEN